MFGKKFLVPLVLLFAFLAGGYLLLVQARVVAQGPAPDVDAQGIVSSNADVATLSVEMTSPPDNPAIAHVGFDEPENTPNSVEGTAWRSLRVSGLAFRPRVSSVEYARMSGCLYQTAGSSIEIFNIHLDLPYGSTIQGLRLYYNDTDSLNSTAWLTKYDLYGTIVKEWSVSSSGNTGFGFTSTYFTDTVDYETYSYVLNWRPNIAGTTMQLCGMRVFYTPPPLFGAFLPAVQRP